MNVVDNLLVIPSHRMGIRFRKGNLVEVLHAEQEEIGHLLGSGGMGIAVQQQSWLEQIFGIGARVTKIDHGYARGGIKRTCLEIRDKDDVIVQLHRVRYSIGTTIRVLEPILATGGADTAYAYDGRKLVDLFGPAFLKKIVALGTGRLESQYAPLWTSRFTVGVSKLRIRLVGDDWVQTIMEGSHGA